MLVLVLVSLLSSLVCASDFEGIISFATEKSTKVDTLSTFNTSLTRLKRWDFKGLAKGSIDKQTVLVRDVQTAEVEPELLTNGFQTISLINPSVLPILSAIHSKGIHGIFYDKQTLGKALARELEGVQKLQLEEYFVFNFRCAGVASHKSAPLGKPIKGFPGDNLFASIDQDVEGEPFSKMGTSLLFRSVPFFYPLYVWVPLGDGAIRPLAMMDANSLKSKSTARYRVNKNQDKLVPHFDENQEWWWDSKAAFGHAVISLATKTPISPVSLPGEEVLEKLLGTLLSINSAYASKSEEMFQTACKTSTPVGDVVYASEKTKQLVDFVSKYIHEACAKGVSEIDKTDLVEAIAKNYRTSLEVRCAAVVIPIWGLLCFGLFLVVVLVSNTVYAFIVVRRRNGKAQRKKSKKIEDKKKKEN